MGPRRTVDQTGFPFQLVAVTPLAHRLAIDALGRCDSRYRSARLKTFDHQHSTVPHGSGILMDVQPGLLETAWLCRNNNLSSKPRTDNLHSNDT